MLYYLARLLKHTLIREVHQRNFLLHTRGFIVIDSTSSVGALSVYNCSEDIYEKIRDNSDIYVVEPNLKEINFGDNKWLAI